MGIFLKLRILAGRACKLMSRDSLPPSGIDLSDLLHHLKKPCSPWYSISFQGWGNSKADSLLCPAFICHYQIRSHRIQSPFYTLYRSIEGFQINGNVSSFRHFPGLLILFFSLCDNDNTKSKIEQVFFFVFTISCFFVFLYNLCYHKADIWKTWKRKKEV